MTDQSESAPLPRRAALKLLTGAVAGAFGIKAVEKSFFLGLTSSLDNRQFSNKATEAIAGELERFSAAENPSFRPLSQIIQEGIANYGNPVYFNRIPDYQEASYYAQTIKDFDAKTFFPQSPTKAAQEIINALPSGAFEAYSQSTNVISTFDQLYPTGSGFHSRFRANHPEFVHSSGMLQGGDDLKKSLANSASQEIDVLRKKVEDHVATTQKPVSTSFILTQFLELNHGNLGQSIFDTTLFLKFMARNNPVTGLYSPDSIHVRWYQTHILDEFQGPTFTDVPENETEINLIGKPYHSWNIVALMQFIPLEVIRLGVLQKQLSTLKDQGLSKTLSDVHTLIDLPEIEKVLTSYTSLSHATSSPVSHTTQPAT